MLDFLLSRFLEVRNFNFFYWIQCFLHCVQYSIYLHRSVFALLSFSRYIHLRLEQSHQHRQSSNSALLTRWAHTQSKSETITTRSLTRWSSHIHRRTATSLHTCCDSYTTYTHILRRHDPAFAHIQTGVMQ